uniref:Uncharacterized protein n=1 Tax=Arundo donax TaxID=35708 RepID=A0A0A9C9X4_ARUDO
MLLLNRSAFIGVKTPKDELVQIQTLGSKIMSMLSITHLSSRARNF